MLGFNRSWFAQIGVSKRIYGHNKCSLILTLGTLNFTTEVSRIFNQERKFSLSKKLDVSVNQVTFNELPLNLPALSTHVTPLIENMDKRDALINRFKKERQHFQEKFKKLEDIDFGMEFTSERLVELLRKCIEISDVVSSFQVYDICKTKFPNSITNEDCSRLIYLLSFSIKARHMSNGYSNPRLDRYNHRESLPDYSSKYLKIVFCDIVANPKFVMKEKDWDNLFTGLSKDLDIETTEILWWLLIARNHPSLLNTNFPAPPKNKTLNITGKEKIFYPVKITTTMTNAVIHCRSRTRLDSEMTADDHQAIARVKDMLDYMKILNIPPDESTYMGLISSFHHHFRSDQYFVNSLLQLLETFKQPGCAIKLTIEHYNYVLVCFYQRKRFLINKKLFKELCNSTTKITIDTLNLMLSTLLKHPGKVNVYDFFKSHIEKWELKPTTGTLNILLRNQVQFGETEGIEPLIEEFKGYGVRHNHIGYTHIVRGFVSMGDFKAAEDYLKEYISRQDLPLKPDPFHPLIRGYVEQNCSVQLWDAYSVLIHSKTRIPLKIWFNLIKFTKKTPLECLNLFLVSTQEDHLGRWDIQLLSILIRSFTEAELDLDPVVDQLLQNVPLKKGRKRISLKISDLYSELTGEGLPFSIRQKLGLESQPNLEVSACA